MLDADSLVPSRLRVIFICVGLFPKRIVGDKNFILDLSSCLRARGLDVRLVSIAEPDSSINKPGDKPNNTCEIQFIPRVLHFRRNKYHWYDKQGSLIGYHHIHSSLHEFCELLATILSAKAYLKTLYNVSGGSKGVRVPALGIGQIFLIVSSLKNREGDMLMA